MSTIDDIEEVDFDDLDGKLPTPSKASPGDWASCLDDRIYHVYPATGPAHLIKECWCYPRTEKLANGHMMISHQETH